MDSGIGSNISPTDIRCDQGGGCDSGTGHGSLKVVVMILVT